MESVQIEAPPPSTETEKPQKESSMCCVACVCGERNQSCYTRIIRGGIEAALWICPNCGTEQLNKKLTGEYYEERYRLDVPKKPGFYVYPSPEIPNIAVDIGADDGSYLKKVSARMRVAVDPHVINESGILWTPDTFGLRDNSVDWLTCWVTIEHVVYPTTLVTEMYRILRPGGAAHLTTPSVEYALKYCDLNDWYRPHHNWYFTKKGLEHLFSKFSAVSIKPQDELWHIRAMK